MSWRRKLITVLASLVVTFCGLEGALRAFDPLGVVVYPDAWGVVRRYEYTPEDDHYLPPGDYKFTHWSATLVQDGQRSVPDTNTAANCTIAALGDSFTFGWGVNDRETWVNQLARLFPDVRFVNAGVYAYTIEQVARAKARTSANGYIYLIYSNDLYDLSKARATGPVTLTSHELSFIELTLKALLITRVWPDEHTIDYEMFDAALGQIVAEDTLVMTFEDVVRSHAEQTFPTVRYFAWEYDTVSALDMHPNAAGHKEGAMAMRPYVAQLISEVCE